MRILSTRLFVGLCAALSSAAWAQSSVTLYGVFDVAAKYEHNADKLGNNMKSLGKGTTGGSRLGFLGIEDLGGGLAAIFKLENGFNADTGTQADAARFWSREAWVGLRGGYGEVRLGHQYSILFENFNYFDPYRVSNVNDSTPYLLYSVGDDPVHKDNAVRYSLNKDKLNIMAMAAPGEVAGTNAPYGRYLGLSARYAADLQGIGAFYEQRNSNSAALPTKRTFGASGGVGVGPANLFASYVHHNANFATTQQLKGNLFSVGATYPITPLLSLVTAYYHDEQKNPSGLDARKDTVSVLTYYNMSKRTGLYAYADTTHWKNGYVELLSDPYAAKTTRYSLMLGMRHNF